MKIKKLMQAVRSASVELRISGDDIVINGIDRLPDDAKTELVQRQRSGWLWAWCGADGADEEAITFAEKLGIEPILIATVTQAADAIHELGNSDGYIGIDIETALRSEHAAPRPRVAINVTGALAADQPINRKAKKSEAKPWADPHLTAIRTVQLYAGNCHCFVFWGEALPLIHQSPLLRERRTCHK